MVVEGQGVGVVLPGRNFILGRDVKRGIVVDASLENVEGHMVIVFVTSIAVKKNIGVASQVRRTPSGIAGRRPVAICRKKAEQRTQISIWSRFDLKPSISFRHSRTVTMSGVPVVSVIRTLTVEVAV